MTSHNEGRTTAFLSSEVNTLTGEAGFCFLSTPIFYVSMQSASKPTKCDCSYFDLSCLWRRCWPCRQAQATQTRVAWAAFLP